MAYLKINGIDVRIDKESVKLVFDEVGGKTERSAIGAPIASRNAKLRRWSMSTSFDTLAEIERLQKLIDGFGLAWSFDDSTKISSTGATPATAVSLSSVTGKYGNGVRIASASNFGVNPQYRVGVHKAGGWVPSMGWTLMCWRWFTAAEAPSAGWYHVILTGSTTFNRAASANPSGVTQYRNGVAGSYDLGNAFSVRTSSPYCGPYGYLTTNVANLVDVDDLVFLPYEITATWASAFYTLCSTRAWPKMPLVDVDGTMLTANIAAKGEVNDSDERWQNGAMTRNLSFELLEDLSV